MILSRNLLNDAMGRVRPITAIFGKNGCGKTAALHKAMHTGSFSPNYSILSVSRNAETIASIIEQTPFDEQSLFIIDNFDANLHPETIRKMWRRMHERHKKDGIIFLIVAHNSETRQLAAEENAILDFDLDGNRVR